MRVLFPFKAEDAKELSVSENEKLMVQEVMGQWVFVTSLERMGQSGFVPVGFLDHILEEGIWRRRPTFQDLI